MRRPARRWCVSIYPQNMRDEDEARDIVQDAFERCGEMSTRLKVPSLKAICLPLLIIR